MDIELLKKIEERALKGIPTEIDQVMTLYESLDGDRDVDLLCDAAGRVAAARCSRAIETCSIINARSGRCSEDCRWCSQSLKHHTGCEEYRFCSDEAFSRGLDDCRRRGVQRYSMVCSGRKVPLKDIRVFCSMAEKARREAPEVQLCASMGLLGRDELQALYDAGVRRYHCNLETAESKFGELCTTHTRADKLRTIALAREVGMEVCSGGIIGMGETMRQRVELADEARRAGAVSLPLNLLNPIPGTPLENQPLLGEREAIISAALMRLVAPDLVIRFAGGRARLSKKATERMLTGGVNGVMIGDMLTTPGNSPEDDMAMFAELSH